jgi:undecaprenyl-diphosphatase
VKPFRQIFPILTLGLACFAGPAACASDEVRMSYGQAVVLGAVEGLTEYLPVSSTGHLLLAQRLMGLQTNGSKTEADAYAIAIQLGAILAVLGLYRRRWLTIIRGFLPGGDPAGRRLAGCLLAAFLPFAILGLSFGPWIKEYLFEVIPVALAWLAGGIGLLAWDTRRHERGWRERGCGLETMTLRQALGIGLIQCVAFWPGISRSLATLAGGLAAGLCLPAAVEFSFLLGLVSLGTATAYEMFHSGTRLVEVYGWARPLAGLAVSFIFAVLSVRWFVSFLRAHTLHVFGWYRVGLGVLTLVALRLGWL